jgi:trk system potassium uptake protein
VWWGVFHSVTAFNNAGFDVIGGFRSLVPFNADALVLGTVALLILFGSISYTVVEDVARHRSWRRLTLDSKLVLITSAGLVVAGMVGLLVTETRNGATLGGMDLGQRISNALFHSISPRTAGYNSVDMAQMTDSGLLVTMALMFIGGAAGSTAGGVKLQTFSLLFFAILSAAAGAREVQAFKRTMPMTTVLRGIAVVLLSIAVVFAVGLTLDLIMAAPFVHVLFEAFSAFATVGLSTGITPGAGLPAHLVLIVTMFIGRLGPLTLAVALAARERRITYRWAEEGVRIG